MTSIRKIRLDAIHYLKQHNIPSSTLCVDILLAHLLHYSTIHDIRLHEEEFFPEDLLPEWNILLARVVTEEPIAYIVGAKDFIDFQFYVDKHTLIPRPETEELMYLIIPTLQGASDTILDIGTGSGCIACSLALYSPQSKIIALDISYNALLIATKNIQKYNIKSIVCLQSDLYELPFQESSFSHIIANPPYLSKYEHKTLSKTVADFEPYSALVSGETGLEASIAIIEQGYFLLKEKGLLFLEIGHTQRNLIEKYVQEGKWSSFSYKKDYSHKERFIILQK